MPVKFPEVNIQLTGMNGNVFNLMAICRREMHAQQISRETQNEFTVEVCRCESYDDALQLMMNWFDVH